MNPQSPSVARGPEAANQWEVLGHDERLDQYLNRVFLGNPLIVTRGEPSPMRGNVYESKRTDLTVKEIATFVEFYFEQAGYDLVQSVVPHGESALTFHGVRAAENGEQEEIRGEITIRPRDYIRDGGLDVQIFNEGPVLTRVRGTNTPPQAA